MAAPRKRYTPRKAVTEPAAVATATGIPAIVGTAAGGGFPAAGGALPALAPKAGITTGADGRGPRLSWARYSPDMGQGGFGSSPVSLVMGGRLARDSREASVLANDLALSNPLIATIVETSSTNAVFTGLTLSAKPDAAALGITSQEARKLSHDLETAWAAWASNPIECDATGRFDIHSLVDAAYRSAVLSGEYIIVFDWRKHRHGKCRTKVKLLDARQLDVARTGIFEGRKTINGVSFDDNGCIIGYWLFDIPLGSISATPISQFVAAYTSWGRRRVFHNFQMLDPRQVRGLSPIAAGITPAHDANFLAELTLGNSALQSTFALTVESDLPPQAALNSLRVNDDESGMLSEAMEMREAWYSKARIKPDVATVNFMSPGDRLRMNTVNNPSSTYQDFDNSLARKAARAAGESYEAISGSYKDTSFSASRLAMEMPYRVTMRRRKALVVPLYQAIFEAFAEEAIETGLVDVPATAFNFNDAKQAFCKAKWLGLGRIEPDRRKAVDAVVQELANGLVTFEDALAEKGIDLEQHLEALKAEREMLRTAGINHPFGASSVQVREVEDVPSSANDPAAPSRRKRK